MRPECSSRRRRNSFGVRGSSPHYDFGLCLTLKYPGLDGLFAEQLDQTLTGLWDEASLFCQLTGKEFRLGSVIRGMWQSDHIGVGLFIGNNVQAQIAHSADVQARDTKVVEKLATQVCGE